LQTINQREVYFIVTSIKLRQTALSLFAESGYDSVSLSEIAKAVGIKTPSIYAHFSSKEQLFLQLVEETAREEIVTLSHIIAGIQSHSAENKLNAVYRFFTDLAPISSGRAFLKRIIFTPPKLLKERLQQEVMIYEDQLSSLILQILNEGEKAGETVNSRNKELMALFLGLTDGLMVEAQLYDLETYKDRQHILWEWFKQLLLKG
jgi:AcrR family transcriptional regulator